MRSTRDLHRRAKSTPLTAETPLFKQLPPALPVVERLNETRPLLKPGPFAQRSDVLALDFIRGSGHGCCFCPARLIGDAHPLDSVGLADNVAERLTEELLDSHRFPSAVFVSPNSDPFPPLQEIHVETGRIVEVLSRNGIETWLMTRGFIRPAILDVLRRHAEHVKVTMAMTTLDRTLQRALEPLSAPPKLRLKTIQALREAGISCNAALEPLIPGVTDTRQNLMPVLEALSQAGVRQVTVGYLVLHQHAEPLLQASLRPLGLDTMVLEEYARGPVLRADRGPAGRYLPRSRRQHGYAALMAMAAGMGLRVSINAQTNPDFAAVQPSAIRRASPAGMQLSAG